MYSEVSGIPLRTSHFESVDLGTTDFDTKSHSQCNWIKKGIILTSSIVAGSLICGLIGSISMGNGGLIIFVFGAGIGAVAGYMIGSYVIYSTKLPSDEENHDENFPLNRKF